MAQKHRNNQERKRSGRSHYAPVMSSPPVVYERKPPVVFDKPIVVLEDRDKNTFEFKAGAWVAHAYTIAECRAQNCQVKELAQKVNNMTRYEVRYPLPTAT